MTRAQLEAVHEALTELIDSWNDAAADEDRGPSNHAITLTIFDDGSGFLGRRRSEGSFDEFYEFNDCDELLRVLTEYEHVELAQE